MVELHDIETEGVLLAACVFKPELYHLAAEHTKPGDFSNLLDNAIYQSIGELHGKGIKPDQVTIRDSAGAVLARGQMFPDSEDLVTARINDLKKVRFAEENIREYAKKIQRLSLLRMMDQALHDGVREITGNADPGEIASQTMATLLKIINPTDEKNILHYSEIRERYKKTLQREVEYIEKFGEAPGIRFGFSPVDSFTHGMRPEELWVLAGEPGSGKTAVMMSLLRNRALLSRTSQNVGGSLFVSLEMGEDATAMRWSQMIGDLTTRELRQGMTRRSIAGLDQKWQEEDSVPLWCLFAANMQAEQLKARIAYMVKQYNIDLVVIDHFRRIKVSGKLYGNELDEARIQYLKSDICKNLGVTVVVIAHTNKSSAMREDKKPRMSDLSGSQMVAAEPDYITFVYRPWESLSDSERADPSCPYDSTDAYLVWRKNRNDRLGDARFIFDGSTMRITDPSQKPVHEIETMEELF